MIRFSILLTFLLFTFFCRAAIVDCAEESVFAVIGSSGEKGLEMTAKALGEAIARREGWSAAPAVEVVALPGGDAAENPLLELCAKVKAKSGIKRVGALVTPAVYDVTTNRLSYACRSWPDAAKFPMGWNKHADMLRFAPGGAITEETLDFVCGYRVDWDNPVCSFESGEPPMTAAEAVAAMEAGDWVDAEVEKTRRRIRDWQGADEAVLVAFECDLHIYSPVRGKWAKRSDLVEGNFRHVKRFARAAAGLGVDVAADLGDLGYDFSGRHWKHACKGERASRMAIQSAGYDLFKMPFMAVQGNHDTHWTALDGFGKLFNPEGSKRTDGFVFGPTRGYGYHDIAAKRTRLFFVNTSEGGNGGEWRIRPDQVDFHRKAVAATPDGWTVAFFSHDCFHRTAGDRDWKERAGCKASKTYCDMRALLESIAAGKRLKLAGAYCGDSHMNRLHEENGVRYFVCDAAFNGAGPKNLLVHVAAINPRTGEGRLFRIGARGAKGDL